MSTEPDLLARAVAIAAEVHAGQRDKGGAPYILHPLRVMLSMETLEERMAAALHDVVEDSEGHWTLDRLRTEGFPEVVVCAVDAVTRREDENYADFVVRAAGDPLGRRVKLGDLRDNLDVTRLRLVAEPELNQTPRLRRYQRAWDYVTGVLSEADYRAAPE